MFLNAALVLVSMVRPFLKVYMELGSYFLFLQEQIKDIIIIMGRWSRLSSGMPARNLDEDVFYLFLKKQKIGAKLHIYPWEGTYHKRLFRGLSTNDIKK